jgi:hypothetical protein
MEDLAQNDVLGRNLPKVNLPTTNPYVMNPGGRGGNPATDRLSYCMALLIFITQETKM